MNIDDRLYSVQLHFAEAGLSASLTMIPASSRLGRMAHQEVLKELAGPGAEVAMLPVAANVATMRQLRELIAALILEAADVRTDSVPRHTRRLADDIGFNESRLFAVLSPMHQEIVDYLLSAPILPIEQSWAVVRNLGAAVMVAGGISLAGLGVIGDDAEIVSAGAVLTSAGPVVLAIRKDQQLQAPMLTPPHPSPEPPPPGSATKRPLAEIIAEIRELEELSESQKSKLIFKAAERHYGESR